MKNVARPIVTLIKDGGKNSYITDVHEIMKELNNRYKNNPGNSNYGVPFLYLQCFNQERRNKNEIYEFVRRHKTKKENLHRGL